MARRSLLILLSIWALFSQAIGAPLAIVERDTEVSKVPLRILPLGASITWGTGSSTGNGYRKPLYDELKKNGFEVEMVGSKEHGDMKDRNVEAHEGDVIDQVKAASRNSLKYKPNVVLVEAGTNDANQNGENNKNPISKAGERMNRLIDTLVDAPGMEDTVVILSTLLPSGAKNVKANRPSINKQFEELVKTLSTSHKKISVVLADMSSIQYPKEFHDQIHPNDDGYTEMASIWYKAISKAAKDGLIHKAS